MTEEYLRGYKAALEEALTLTAERIAEMVATERRIGALETRDVLHEMRWSITPDDRDRVG